MIKTSLPKLPQINPEEMLEAMKETEKIMKLIKPLADLLEALDLPSIEIVSSLSLKDEAHKGKSYVAILIEKKAKP